MKRAPALLLALVLAAAATLAAQQPPKQTFRFEIDVAPELFPPDVVPRPLDGRVLLIVSNDRSQEPRFQVGRGLNSQLLFGIDVEGLKPEPSSSFVMQQREAYDSFGRLSIIPVRTLIERRMPPAVVDAMVKRGVMMADHECVSLPVPNRCCQSRRIAHARIRLPIPNSRFLARLRLRPSRRTPWIWLRLARGSIVLPRLRRGETS